MKKLTLVMLAFLVGSTLPATAQFGKLLEKAKSAVSGGSAGKKSGSFATVWESEFENKASRLAVVNSKGTIVLGTDDNSASSLDKEGKAVWNGDYKKINTHLAEHIIKRILLR